MLASADRGDPPKHAEQKTRISAPPTRLRRGFAVGSETSAGSGPFTATTALLKAPVNMPASSEESVPAKEEKTQADLIALLMGELRKHPECDHVVRITITLPVQIAPHYPNWDVAWTIGGNQILCPVALRIAGELQAKFDLLL